MAAGLYLRVANGHLSCPNVVIQAEFPQGGSIAPLPSDLLDNADVVPGGTVFLTQYFKQLVQPVMNFVERLAECAAAVSAQLGMRSHVQVVAEGLLASAKEDLWKHSSRSCVMPGYTYKESPDAT